MKSFVSMSVLLFFVGLLAACGGGDLVSPTVGTFSGSIDGTIDGVPVQEGFGYDAVITKVKNDTIKVTCDGFSFETKVTATDSKIMSAKAEGITFSYDKGSEEVNFTYKTGDTDVTYKGEPKIE